MQNNKDILILGIESSCDETSASLVKDGRYVLSNVISSQIDIHKDYGGVVPEIASRKHIEVIDFVIDKALLDANKTFDDVDAVAVTYGPGLVGALLVGISHAKALAYALNKPLIGVHHIEGHICSNYIKNKELKPPFICLVVSGGHTHLVEVKGYSQFEILGKTRDDAVGEAFDKVARALGLSYPGGPMIDNLSKEGNPLAIEFPRVMLEKNSYDFSFSGIKSSVLNFLNRASMTNTEYKKADVASSFQKAVVDVLVEKSIRACREKGYNILAIAGGVSANSYLREVFLKRCEKESIQLNIPDLILCTDNAAMISSAGYFEYINNNFKQYDLNAYPNLVLGERI